MTQDPHDADALAQTSVQVSDTRSRWMWILAGVLTALLGVLIVVQVLKPDPLGSQAQPSGPEGTQTPQSPSQSPSPDPTSDSKPSGEPGQIYSWGAPVYLDFVVDSAAAPPVNDSEIKEQPRLALGLSGITSIQRALSGGIALTDQGTVMAWGMSLDEVLGQRREIEESHTPVQIPGLADVKSIHTLVSTGVALLNDGTVTTWGSNKNGALGAGITDPGLVLSPLVQVEGLANVAQIVLGNGSVYAVLDDGSVWAWGSNKYGLLGAGLESEFEVAPVQVKGLTDVQTIETGLNSAFALKKDGTVAGWGSNFEGVLGPDFDGRNSTVPVMITGVQDARSVAVTHQGAYAVLKDNAVIGWDNKSRDLFGGGAGPVKIPGLTNIQEIVSGYANNAYAINQDGTVFAWGDNDLGLNGNGQTQGTQSQPAKIDGLANVKSMAVCYTKAYAVLDNNTVMTWGSQRLFDLTGGPERPDIAVPIVEPALLDIDRIVCDDVLAYAITAGDG